MNSTKPWDPSPKMFSGSWDGLPRPQELTWVSEHFLERVPMPIAVFQSLGQIERHQASEPLPENVPGPEMVFRGLRNLLGSWNIFWKEFRCLWQHSKGLRKMNSTRPWEPFQKMFQVPGLCSEASGTYLSLRTFPGKCSNAYGSIPKPWAN